MALDNRKQWLEAQEGLPQKYADGVTVPARSTRRGEQVVLPFAAGKNHLLADEGSYFVATNPTPGTAIVGIAAANGLDDTEALIYMRHPSNATTRVYLDYIMLKTVAVGANGTDYAVAMKTDTGNSRYSSGGSSITPVNPNMASSESSALSELYFGAVVPTAATSEARLVHHAQLRSAIKVAGDTFVFSFGGQPAAPLAALSGETTTPVYQYVPCPPVIIGPGDMFLLHEFASSQDTAASFEFAMGWWER